MRLLLAALKAFLLVVVDSRLVFETTHHVPGGHMLRGRFNVSGLVIKKEVRFKLSQKPALVHAS